ncbi:photosynthetic complex putative assembly protein PuhB [Roseovarius salis]|uniref:photosynthetic complex putative assembly protein PuhB n=1 Tax=Roseovarius salis TaxID=3376063 RepID=UPI0037C50D5F
MSHDDFAFEPVKGLPERPPKGEQILWQGRPHWWALTRESLNLTWVAGYFVLLAAWRFVTLVDQIPTGAALAASSPLLVMGGLVCALLLAIGIVQARSTVYTITTSRVAMRIGAALTVTLNLPYTQIRNADLDLRRGGTGTIALELKEETRLSYLVCWPHVRPWKMRRTQPALRCIPDAQRVATLLADAAQARVTAPQVARSGSGSAAAMAAE